jgi:hypothetical protein
LKATPNTRTISKVLVSVKRTVYGVMCSFVRGTVCGEMCGFGGGTVCGEMCGFVRGKVCGEMCGFVRGNLTLTVCKPKGRLGSRIILCVRKVAVHLGYSTQIWLSVSKLPLKCAVVSLNSVVNPLTPYDL